MFGEERAFLTPALRSARLIVADFLHIDQKPKMKRLMIAFPLFACVFGLVFVNFDIVWRYFSWTNQTLAMFTLWAGTVWLYKNGRRHSSSATNSLPIREGSGVGFGYLIALIPALFMTMVSTSYILIAPEGFRLPEQYRWIGYAVAGVITVALLLTFVVWTRRYTDK